MLRTRQTSWRLTLQTLQKPLLADGLSLLVHAVNELSSRSNFNLLCRPWP